MNKKVGVIGLGRFGSQVAISLAQKGFDVLAIDLSEDAVTELKDVVTRAVILDATDEKAMRAVQVDNLDMAVVAFGTNVQESLLSVALLQKLGAINIVGILDLLCADKSPTLNYLPPKNLQLQKNQVFF